MAEMQATELAILCTIVGTGLGAIGKVMVDAYSAKTKEKLDQLQIALRQIEDLQKREDKNEEELRKSILEASRWKARCEQMELDLQYVRGQLANFMNGEESDQTNR